MCGRFTLTTTEQEIAIALPGLRFDVPIRPRFNIAPTQGIPAVLNELPDRVQELRWGLVPSWAKDPAIGSRMINARGETVHEKPSFKRPFLRQRCLILADGYYEWQEIPGQKRKQPLYIRRRDRAAFVFGGLWDRWRGPDGQILTTAAIITTVPNKLLAQVHDRMPLILPRERWALWLSQAEQPLECLRDCIASFPAEWMEYFPVSTAVNRATFDDPACIAPLAS